MVSGPVVSSSATNDGHTAAPTLNRSMTMAEAGRAVLGWHFGRMLASERGTVLGHDPEALHDMRVATRRLRAGFRVFRDAYDATTVAAVDGEVRWLAGVLGRVRDLDVLAEAVAAHDRDRAERRQSSLSWVMAAVVVERAAERVALVEALASPRYLALKESMARFLAGGDLPAQPGGAPDVRAQAASAIERQLRSLRRAGRAARSGDMDDLHALRIVAKRVRYTLEFFRDLFAPEMAGFIQAVTAVQDHLGAMRDAQVQFARLTRLRLPSEAGEGGRRALRGLLRYLRQREASELEAFRAAYPAIASREARRRARSLLQSCSDST